ncbi:MAG: histidinol-phosphate transaminase [Chloroflexota bacterium]
MDYPFSTNEHGGIVPGELERLGIDARQVVDFSTNTNPFGPAPGVLEAAKSVDIAVYPDRDCSVLRSLIAQHSQTSQENILVGNGTSELIWLISAAFLRPKDAVVIIAPTFTEYRRAANMQAAKIIEFHALPLSFNPPLGKALEVMRRIKPRLVFLCNPNNPTGKYILEEDLQEFAANLPDDCLLVLDEAYISFVKGLSFKRILRKNCIVLRSMTKDFALAGLRLGYAMAEPDLIQRLKEYQPTWSVNAAAQAAGRAAFSELAQYQQKLNHLRELKSEFFAGLETIGYAIVPSNVHFGLIKLDRSAQEVRLALLQQFILVRDCASFGLPQYIRVSTKLQMDNEKLLKSLGALH